MLHDCLFNCHTVTPNPPTDWWPVLLSGIIGAVLGLAGAFGAARFVANRERGERSNDRQVVFLGQTLAEVSRLQGMVERSRHLSDFNKLKDSHIESLQQWNTVYNLTAMAGMDLAAELIGMFTPVAQLDELAGAVAVDKIHEDAIAGARKLEFVSTHLSLKLLDLVGKKNALNARQLSFKERLQSPIVLRSPLKPSTQSQSSEG